MAENHDFYNVYTYSDNLSHGDEMTIKHSISIRDEAIDLSDLIVMPIGKLEALRTASAEKETNIFQNLREAVKEWEEQAANTRLLDKAIEYEKTPPSRHSLNQWELNEYGSHSISNMVYKMTYSVREDTKYDLNKRISVPAAWYLSWSLCINDPGPFYSRVKKIAGQERKRFTDKTAMEKYMKGRIAAYASYFAEVSPPIPQEYLHHFKVNGHLLPGYTPEEKQPEHAALQIQQSCVSISAHKRSHDHGTR